jgi:hypothetical protein
MFISTNVIQTTLSGNITLSELADPTLLDNELRAFTSDLINPALPTDAPVTATGGNGFTMLQFGTTQIYQQNGAAWIRSVAVLGQWIPLLPPNNPGAVSGFPYGITNLPLEYKALSVDVTLDFYNSPGIYIGDESANGFVGSLPTGASGQGFSLQVSVFPTTVSGVTHQGYVQTYTDNVGEWKRATSSTGALSAWVQIVTF